MPNKLKIKAIAFSEKGVSLGTRLEIDTTLCQNGELKNWTEENFYTNDALIFFGSCGIAVRAIAPFLKSKITDPAVIVIDEYGKSAVSLLSGHIGGANKLCVELARKIGANAVITTASDISEIENKTKNIVVGIGCKKGTTIEKIELAITAILWRYEIPMSRVLKLASIDVKKNEESLIEFSKLYNLPISFYSAADLNAFDGDFTASEFVKKTVGTDNVCERSAYLCSEKGKKIIPKTSKNGVTISAYEIEKIKGSS